tara:strand:- start:390 stop:617 length:228 start_codon:yes stop_codon:yes gene_type:complete
MKLLNNILVTFLVLLLVGCSQHNNNYVTANPFVLPKSESHLVQFNHLYPTGHINNQDIKLAKQEKDLDLLPPNMG